MKYFLAADSATDSAADSDYSHGFINTPKWRVKEDIATIYTPVNDKPLTDLSKRHVGNALLLTSFCSKFGNLQPRIQISAAQSKITPKMEGDKL